MKNTTEYYEIRESSKLLRILSVSKEKIKHLKDIVSLLRASGIISKNSRE